ncbi:hypothetical protein COHA_006337 [Chlorella ohadii]|uniref:Uncharacterized protein n=1 Tax=Chlorella ohadii TaxID=2649997 RepID=A0AAD5H3X8_9CHLO|nr:hypothetical protein COHA_006337 [Chlorella ohadii]
MACLSRPTLSLAAARPAPAVQQQQQRVSARPAAVQRRASRRGRVAAAAGNGTSESSPVIGAPQQQHVIRMVNLVTAYFDTLLTQGDSSIIKDILEPTISHKDMVRNIGRVGMKEYETYLSELHRTYPEYWVKPIHFGFADNKSMFVSFEGQVNAKTPKFSGVDFFVFNNDATKIQEVQVFRSSWLGAQGHDERKKLAEAAARIEAQQAAQRSQMP